MSGAVTIKWCHLVAAMLWALAVLAVLVGFADERLVLGNFGIVLSAVAAATTVCASYRLHTARVIAAVGRASQPRGPRSLPDD